MNQVDGSSGSGDTGLDRSAHSWARTGAKRVAAAGGILVVLGLLVSFGLIEYLHAHRDPTGGSPQDTLAEYAHGLKPSQRVYWLPEGGVTVTPLTNPGQTKYIAVMQAVQYNAPLVSVEIVTQFGDAGRNLWFRQQALCCLPPDEVVIGRWRRPGDEIVLVYAFNPPRDRDGLRRAVRRQLAPYRSGEPAGRDDRSLP